MHGIQGMFIAYIQPPAKCQKAKNYARKQLCCTGTNEPQQQLTESSQAVPWEIKYFYACVDYILFHPPTGHLIKLLFDREVF